MCWLMLSKSDFEPMRCRIRSQSKALLSLAAFVALTFVLLAQSGTAPALTPAENLAAAGDSPAAAPPLARDLSPRLLPLEIQKAMRKVGDWEINRSQANFNKDWTFAVLYAGFMAASKTLPDSGYGKAMLAMGSQFDWRLGPRLTHADDQAMGQTYLELYFRYHDPKMLNPTREQFHRLMKTPGNPAKPAWWWCDALFMAPPVWARLYKATGNTRYLDYMDREWWITSRLLYDPEEHLFARDAKYLDKHEANGKRVFWARGNGWVMGGLVRVLQFMPEEYPTRAKYMQQFKEMATKIASIQGGDGLWRTGLLDPGSYSLPEDSGSSLFTYALAWGVNEGVLDRATYMPTVQKAWRGLLSHIYSDGRLGCIQPIGEAPGHFLPTSSYVYGSGAFLLAGSEVEKLAETVSAPR